MAKTKVVQNSLVSGVINETAWGRTDIAKFYSGVAEANNMIVQTTGGMFKRPGFEFIDTTRATKTEYELNNKSIRLIDFVFNTKLINLIDLLFISYSAFVARVVSINSNPGLLNIPPVV